MRGGSSGEIEVILILIFEGDGLCLVLSSIWVSWGRRGIGTENVGKRKPPAQLYFYRFVHFELLNMILFEEKILLGGWGEREHSSVGSSL